MYLINGQIEAHFPIRDRGLAYGDGLFETIAIIDQVAHNWDLHLLRLTAGAKRLSISLPDEQTLLDGLSYFFQHINSDKFILKIILTRGGGGGGYQCPENQASNWIMLSSPWPVYPLEYYLDGIDVQQLDFQLSVQPALAGIKHLNRLEQVLARQGLSQQYQEAILCNTKGDVIEGISSNVYFGQNDILLIPSLSNSGIEGTIRSQIMTLCQQLNIKFKIANFSLDVLNDSEEIFYSNSIMGLWPVKKICLLNNDEKYFQVGKIYLKLAKIINKQLGYPSGTEY
jgi:4-amino-4-deoxychorismate lyase